MPTKEFHDETKVHPLCRLEDIADGDSKEVALPGEDDVTLCLVRQGDRVYGYRNHCPHTGVPLNWQKDKFLSLDGTWIQCTVHGALFRISDGFCIWGPCLNRSLQAVPITILDDAVVMLESPT